MCAEISRELGELGLITLPQTLPASENEHAWVIQKDSELGEVVSVAVAIAHLDALNMNPIPHLFANYPTAKASLS
ncbi:hypothetical protein ACFH04_27235 [Streptomyces noboritoensis]|uniref:Uncharacterized protein n=1 Tax=Streptomyces noboritoensis TaxID=67337 RepID=A0ABV6TSE2_9ACTN